MNVMLWHDMNDDCEDSDDSGGVRIATDLRQLLNSRVYGDCCHHGL